MKNAKFFMLSIALIMSIFCEMFLFISYKKPDMKSIAYQHTDSSFAEDIEKIEYTNNTQRKGLTTSYLEIKKSNVNEVNKYSKVEHLSIDGTDIKTMPDLTGLQVYGISVKNVKFFDLKQFDLDRISSITLDRAYVTEASDVGRMKNLKSLTINESGIDNIDFLRLLPNLTTLAIWNSDVKDFSAMDNLKLLDSLTISNCKLKDVAFLENCPSIAWLDLHRNLIADISSIKTLDKLRYIDLSRNKIRDMVDLSTLKELSNINLSFNEISDIKVPVKELYSADLSYNKITTLNDKMMNSFKTLPDNTSLYNFNVFGNVIENNNQLKKYEFISYRDENNVSFTYEEYEKYIKQIKYIVDKYTDSTWDDLKKAIAVYDYIALNTKFDYDLVENEVGRFPLGNINISHTEYGALINKKAVCDGLSYAYRDILKHLGIECTIYHGDVDSLSDNSSHAWNVINIDGEYYHCDLTRNGGAVGLGCFGVSDSTLKNRAYFLLDTTAPKCNKDMDKGHLIQLLNETRRYAGVGTDEYGRYIGVNENE